MSFLIFALLTGLHLSSPPPVPVALQEWYREAELKHARVAMMAVVGFIFTDFYTLPGYEFTTIEAHDAGVANGSMSQLLLWIGGRGRLCHQHRPDAARLGTRTG